MIRRVRPAMLVLLAAAACGGSSSTPKTPTRGSTLDTLPPDRRDAALLGREVFSLVDRAADYKGSHLGHPPSQLRQMGIESLTPLVVRRIRVVSDTSVITVAFRQPRGRAVSSCEGTAEVLEEASLRGGTFGIVCTTPSGNIAKFEVPAP